MRSTDRFPEELCYGFDMQGRGMATFLAGIGANGVEAEVVDNVLFIEGLRMPYMSVVVRTKDDGSTGFLVDVPGYNLVTYWPNRRGVYNWAKIVERVRLCQKINKSVREHRQAQRVSRFGE